MLIENAIKHNVVSRANPLEIELFRNDDYYFVENIIQLKSVPEESTQTGLSNIRQRYEYLCGRDALIVHSNGKFSVQIPIIQIKNESTDRRG